MSKYPRGILLIINNEVFIDSESMPRRDGTNKDCEAIENLFRDQLGFVVKKKQNLNLEVNIPYFNQFSRLYVLNGLF